MPFGVPCASHLGSASSSSCSDGVCMVLLGTCRFESPTNSFYLKVCFNRFENSCTGFLLVCVYLLYCISFFNFYFQPFHIFIV